MKPLTVAMLCAACCFGAAGASFLLFLTLHESPQPAPSPAPAASDSAPRAATTDDYPEILRREIGDLRRELDRLKHRNDRLERNRPDPIAGEDSDADGAEVFAANSRLDELQDRLEAIERSAASGGAMRLSAQIDLTEGNRRERRDAAELLGMLAKGGDEAAKQALLDALKNENPQVREEALEGISKSGLPEFIPALKEAMNDENAGVRREVAEALRDMPIEEAGPILAQMLNDENPRVLIEAVDAIGDAGYENARLNIYPLTSHDNERVALEAAIALRRTGDPNPAEGWVTRLGERVNSESARERRSAVWQLRRMRLQSARPYLEKALESSDWRVRRNARRALNELDEE